MGFEDNYKPIIVQIGCQVMYAGLMLSVRGALLEDMSSTLLVFYRQSIGFFLIDPFVYFSRRGTNGCRLNWKSFWLIFLVSFLGVTINQNAVYEVLSLVPSPVASAMTNTVPATTLCVIGGAAVIIGLYSVLWGRGEEKSSRGKGGDNYIA